MVAGDVLAVGGVVTGGGGVGMVASPIRNGCSGKNASPIAVVVARAAEAAQADDAVGRSASAGFLQVELREVVMLNSRLGWAGEFTL